MSGRKGQWVLFVIFLCGSSLGKVWAEDTGLERPVRIECHDRNLGNWPVLAEGRIKPLKTHVRELFQKYFVQQCDELRESWVESYCRLSTGQRLKCQILVRADHVSVREILSKPGERAGGNFFASLSRFYAPGAVEANLFRLRNELQTEENEGRGSSGLSLSLGQTLMAYQLWQRISQGQDWTFLGQSLDWRPLREWRDEEPLADSTGRLTEAEQRGLRYEILLEDLNPLGWAMGVGVIAFLLALFSVKKIKFAALSSVAAVFLLVIETVVLVLRTAITGRAPVATMFETVFWSGVGALAVGFLLSKTKKNPVVLAIALGFNLIVLFMMKFATGMLDGNLRPLVPVLRDNFWLSTHVTTITLAYATLGLAWLTANTLLVGMTIFRQRSSLSGAWLREWNELLRLMVQIGSLLLAAGIILGGVWADYSWGRFWGWDPKETWSLIALMIYMMVLHARYAGWLREERFTMSVAAGFLSILMAWFGVNYILATGLHSYGFSVGGALFLVTVFVAQVAVIGLSFVRQRPG